MLEWVWLNEHGHSDIQRGPERRPREAPERGARERRPREGPERGAREALERREQLERVGTRWLPGGWGIRNRGILEPGASPVATEAAEATGR